MPGISLKIRHSAECLLNRQCDLIKILVTDEDFLAGDSWVRYFDFRNMSSFEGEKIFIVGVSEESQKFIYAIYINPQYVDFISLCLSINSLRA